MTSTTRFVFAALALFLFVLSASLNPQSVSARSEPAESPAVCEAQYKECLADCDKDPNNQSSEISMKACRGRCDSVRSGCGTPGAPPK